MKMPERQTLLNDQQIGYKKLKEKTNYFHTIISHRFGNVIGTFGRINSLSTIYFLIIDDSEPEEDKVLLRNIKKCISYTILFGVKYFNTYCNYVL